MLRQNYAVLSCALILSATAFAAPFKREVSREWSQDRFEKLAFAVSSSDVEITGWDKPSVQLIVTMSVDTSNQEKADKAFESIVLNIMENESLRVKVEEKRSGWSWLMFWRNRPDVSVQVFAPDSVPLKVATGSGDIVLDNVNTTVSCATGSGDIVSNGFSGSFSAATGAGDVSFSGNIQQFDVATGAGDVQIEANQGPTQKSAVATGKGDVSVLLSRSANFSLNAEVGFGDIVCNFPLLDLKEDKDSLSGHTHPDAPKIGIATGFGDVQISQLDWQE
jgi:hypothetical protein